MKKTVSDTFRYGVQMCYREKTWDIGIVKEVLAAYPINRCADLRPRPVIVDIGAHIGTFAALCLHTWFDARIVAVEPEPENFELLERNCSQSICIQAAVGDPKRGTVRVARYRDGWDEAPQDQDPADWGQNTGGAFILDEPAVANAEKGQEVAGEVQTISLWQACSHIPDWTSEPWIDILKTDCEGAEVEMLEYAGFPLGNIRYILGEVHGPERQEKIAALLEPTHNIEFSKPGGELTEIFAWR